MRGICPIICFDINRGLPQATEQLVRQVDGRKSTLDIPIAKGDMVRADTVYGAPSLLSARCQMTKQKKQKSTSKAALGNIFTIQVEDESGS